MPEINQKSFPWGRIALVLAGFPIISTTLSLLLLKRSVFTDYGFDFFNVFWIIITLWYVLQMVIISRVLISSGFTWKDIGFDPCPKQILYFILGYLLFSTCLLLFIEYTLANSVINHEKLEALSSLTPRTTTARIIFIIMALAAGISEEIVYRAFAISTLSINRVNKFLAILIASIPFVFQHGLKSIDQFWWFFIWGLVFGALFHFSKRLWINIVIHWLIILSAMVAVLQVIEK